MAIRNNQIYLVHKPEIKLSETLIFLDVEGIPDQNFYYLIGLVVATADSNNTFSFWADNQDQEEIIWKQFLAIVGGYESFTLLHYGSYETEFMEKMWRKYSVIDNGNDEALITKIKSNSINVLSLIYANIYFPTYSNGLKDIGTYLGAQWSAEDASGLQSLVWRHKWALAKDEAFKQKLIEYNSEDILAIKIVLQAIIGISGNGNNSSDALNILLAEDVKSDPERRKFKRNAFALEELEFVNKCAYFD
ncbi:MAG: TM0106 family RecB-like putative nuclease [Acidobacteriota bacterium]